MTRRLRPSPLFPAAALALLAMVLPPPALSAPAQPLNALTPAEASAGWELLFNGTSNAGWVKPDGTPGQFLLEENALGASGSDICTDKDYQDFEFTTDYKYGPAANSGIHIRTRRGVQPPYRSGIEIAIQDNGQADRLYKEGDAAIYGIKAPAVDKWTGPGPWNTLRVRVAGTRIESIHNGEKVVDIDMASAEWDSLFAVSKFSDGTWPLWGKDPAGQICLQYHGHKVLFRNLKVLPLNPGASSRPLPHPTGLRWEIRGSFSDRRLALELPGTGDLDIRLLDLSGKELRVLKGRRGTGFRNEIPLHGLPKGLYWLRVTAPDFAADRRIALL